MNAFKLVRSVCTLLLLIFITNLSLKAQTFGPELITKGNFGTVADGKNGDGDLNDPTKALNIYPILKDNTQNVPLFYQPAAWVYHNNIYIYTEINPNITIGYPLKSISDFPTDYQTEYLWGFDENWNSSYYTFVNGGGGNSWINIPNAPNNKRYIIATGTYGMYNLPSLNAGAWWQVVDKYETNPNNPTNYFLIVNADIAKDKVFYKTNTTLIPGQLYRMSVDIVRLNKNGQGDAPNVNMYIAPEDSNIGSQYVYSTGPLDKEKDIIGAWENYFFYYVAPQNGVNYPANVAFRNNVSGGNGNDLALDNLSVLPVNPSISATGGCNGTDFTPMVLQLNGGIADAYVKNVETNNYTYLFQWEISTDGGLNYNPITSATTTTYSIVANEGVYTAGLYRLSVYTDATTNNKMYSNPINITTENSDCDNQSLPSVARPKANDDEYDVNPDILVTKDIFSNDLTSEGVAGYSEPGRDILRVTQFTIANDPTIYSAGSTVALDGIGVVSIDSLGYLTFRSVPDYVGDVPVITYTLSEKNGGSDTATITITMNQFSWVYNAYCTSCPITVSATATTSQRLTENNYYLYKGNKFYRTSDTGSLVVGSKSSDNKTLTFNFYESQSGTINYSIRMGSENTEDTNTDVLNFSIEVAPNSATWAPNLIIGNDSWDEGYNWASITGSGSPQWCTDVVIPGNSNFYTVVHNGPDDPPSECRDIYFEDGGTVSQIHHLNYRRAYVQLKPNRDVWALYSAPLQYMYSADYHADPSWGDYAGIYPKIYMRYFDINFANGDLLNPDKVGGISTGDFSNAFANLSELLYAGKGFALGVSAKGEYDTFKDDTYNFPRLLDDGNDIEYFYHYSNGNWITGNAVKPSRGEAPLVSDEEWNNLNMTNAVGKNLRGQDSRYRFIIEKIGDPNVRDSISIKNLNPGASNIIGNPLMSHLDVSQLFQINETFNPYYRIWDGTNFYAYLILNGDEEPIWQEDVDAIIRGEDSIPPLYRQVPPMSSFIVDMKPGETQIDIIFDKVSTKPFLPEVPVDPVNPPTEETGRKSAAALRSQKSNAPENVLALKVSMNGLQNRAIVGVFPLASDDYKPNEDVSKLFSYYEESPEIYTISAKTALEINAVKSDSEKKVIPVGVKTSETGKFSIEAINTENFNAYTYLYLWDAKEDIFYNLLEKSTIDLNKETKENVEARYYLIMQNVSAGISDLTNAIEWVKVSSSDAWVTVKSASAEINQIEIFDVTGQRVYNMSNLNSDYEYFSPSVTNGIYIVQVTTNKGIENYKIKI